MGREGFHTLKGYALLEQGLVTSSMEDYLEMIYRMSPVVRISALAAALHVTPPSASKMAGNLREQGLIQYPRYGYITLTETGKQLGAYLIRRHELVSCLLSRINGGASDLEEVEKIEHFFSLRTVENLRAFLDSLSPGENEKGTEASVP